MKNDIDGLMQKHNLDAILVTGPAQHNPAMFYMTGGGHITHADLIKARGEQATLYYNPMERDGAAATGLKTRNLAEYGFAELLAQTDGDQVEALALRYRKMLTEQGLTSGRMAIYGQVEIGAGFAIFSALRKLMPALEIVGEPNNDSMLLDVMATKDKDEIERIRKMGAITTSVVAKVADFLSSRQVEDEVLMQSDGRALTIGAVKSRINLWLAERGVENPHDTIFALGRDAGVPHNTGNPDDELRLGQTIVFDIYPCEAGGGYFYDFTRTWCLGYAPDEAQSLYEDVYAVRQQIMSELEAGKLFKHYQDRSCELFAAQGHSTIKDDPKIQAGYVHNLGHGLGIRVHERPWSDSMASEDNVLSPGSVMTIEPGLYYPQRGMGCRLEDTLWVRPDGQFEIFAEFPLDLVLPMRNK
ncbi:MAG: M24 family metallopeptidase [Chloroflexota bacterium]|nr:M24 family metallopeptidase [Chloroflexota bacterium]